MQAPNQGTSKVKGAYDDRSTFLTPLLFERLIHHWDGFKMNSKNDLA
jgi:hypothetical protein